MHRQMLDRIERGTHMPDLGATTGSGIEEECLRGRRVDVTSAGGKRHVVGIRIARGLKRRQASVGPNGTDEAS